MLKVGDLGLACPAVTHTTTIDICRTCRWDRAPELMCERCWTLQGNCTETRKPAINREWCGGSGNLGLARLHHA